MRTFWMLTVAFALGASLTFGFALAVTQHEASDLDGRLRKSIKAQDAKRRAS